MHSPLEIAKNFVEIGIHKVRLSALKMILLGIFAGIFIGFAGIASTIAGTTIDNPSVGRLVSAAVFPAGLAMVLIAGSELFTGNNLIILSVFEKKVKVIEMLKNWMFVFLGNFIGASLVAAMVVYGNVPDMFNYAVANKMVSSAVAKVNMGFIESLLKGIMCNILVCIAVWAAFAAKKVSGKLLMSFWPIMLFVLCGFEHSIANIYFCVGGILTSFKYNIDSSNLTLMSFLIKNLLPVTIGNIIGGAGVVGLGYWAIYLKHTPGYSHSIEDEQTEIDIAEEY